ncbi:hypothetical protein DM01DRAFT_1337220 [Hesseltinella vesiculosa]|uniref:Golgi apparatus membrane protein TVP38 n=1 Tax=Hesseltinella vesiculosa TaxID=101127 RepID=A0A1X2GEA2_9FUNG|nr:hypothetical protein DM01DRAFT_1337220 [Hesseltinella vesiculosa]
MDTKPSTLKDHGRISLIGTSHLSALHDQENGDVEVMLGKVNSNDDLDPHEEDAFLPFDPANNSSRSPGDLPSHPPPRRNSSPVHSPSLLSHVTFWKTEAARQFYESKRYVMQLDRRQLLQLAFEWRWTLLFLAFFFIMGSIMVAYRKEFFATLESLSKAVKVMGPQGYILMAFLIFLSAFPPMIGYGTFQTLSGFTFGFARGFPVSYFGALTGAVTCFVISRYYLQRRVEGLMKRHPNLEAVVRAVERKGFKLFVLIRLSPYPFNLLNVMFAASDISLAHFAFGTALSLLKIALHVYIGANLTSFSKHILGEDEDLTDSEKQAQTVMEISAVVGGVLATGVMVYVYVVANRAIKEMQAESEEARAFLGDDERTSGDRIAMEEAGITDDWVDWNESDDDDTSLRRRPSVEH